MLKQKKKRLKLIYGTPWYDEARKVPYWIYHYKYGSEILDVTVNRNTDRVCVTSKKWKDYKTFDSLEDFKKDLEEN